MRTLFLVIFFFVIVKCSFSSCISDDRTLTERLFKKEGWTVFSCKILTSTISESENIYSTARIIETYFGIVDSNIITLNTGNLNSSTGGSRLQIGKTYLIYSIGRGKQFLCCDICDKWSKQITDNPDLTHEVQLLKQFAEVFNRKKTANYVFKNANGITIAEGRFKKGKPINIWKHYYDNGIIKSEYDLDSNITSQYSAAGFLALKSSVKNKVEIYEEYSAVVKGQLKAKTIELINDTGMLMQSYLYYDNGNLKNVHGQLNVNRNGDMTSLGRTGIYEEYYENGKLKLNGEYHLGRRIGIWKWYKENGSFDTELDYKYVANGQ